jgi:hypothetical protein
MTPEEREQDIERQIDELTDEALDGAERDLQADLFRAAYNLAELVVAAEAMKAAGQRVRPPSEVLRLLDDTLEHGEWRRDQMRD